MASDAWAGQEPALGIPGFGQKAKPGPESQFLASQALGAKPWQPSPTLALALASQGWTQALRLRLETEWILDVLEIRFHQTWYDLASQAGPKVYTRLMGLVSENLLATRVLEDQAVNGRMPGWPRA